ncbi:hypothetical protein AYO48_04065 [Gaiella sp. SCGC AG-212-M14]|nr:hypothetical protein AYO48_04065 [Gaiella sp. SCGC AG-212-M14]
MWGEVGRTLGDGVSTTKCRDPLEMRTAGLRAILGVGTTGFGLTVESTGGFGVGSTMLTGAETGWPDGEDSNAARQK